MHRELGQVLLQPSDQRILLGDAALDVVSPAVERLHQRLLAVQGLDEVGGSGLRQLSCRLGPVGRVDVVLGDAVQELHTVGEFRERGRAEQHVDPSAHALVGASRSVGEICPRALSFGAGLLGLGPCVRELVLDGMEGEVRGVVLLDRPARAVKLRWPAAAGRGAPTPRWFDEAWCREHLAPVGRYTGLL